MKLFYDHLTQVDSIRPHIEQYVTDPAEIEQIMAELDSAITHNVMEQIFLVLPRQEHEGFLLRFRDNPGAAYHLTYLRQFRPDIEDHLRAVSEASKQRFLDAIHN